MDTNIEFIMNLRKNIVLTQRNLDCEKGITRIQHVVDGEKQTVAIVSNRSGVIRWADSRK